MEKIRVYRKENRIIFRKYETMRNNQQYVATSTESICQYLPQETVEKFHYKVKTAVKIAVHEGILERNFLKSTNIQALSNVPDRIFDTTPTSLST